MHGFEFSTGDIDEHQLAGTYNSPEKLFVHFFQTEECGPSIDWSEYDFSLARPQRNSQNLTLASWSYNFRRQQNDCGMEWDWDLSNTKNPTSLKCGSTLCKFRSDLTIS
jgi:hypothetical protein